MAQHFANYFGVHAEAHHQGSERVTIVVQSGFQPGSFNYFLGDMTDSARV